MCELVCIQSRIVRRVARALLDYELSPEDRQYLVDKSKLSLDKNLEECEAILDEITQLINKQHP